MLDVKLVNEIIMICGRQHMLVKTFEKVRHEESYIVFNIKTLRCFDCRSQMSKAILTE